MFKNKSMPKVSWVRISDQLIMVDKIIYIQEHTVSEKTYCTVVFDNGSFVNINLPLSKMSDLISLAETE